MKVIGIVGMPASGKGEVSRIARDLGIPVVVMGDAIRERVKKAGLPPTDANLGAMSGKLRSELGMDAIARITIPVIEATTAPVVLVDGIRETTRWRRFGSAFPNSRSSGSSHRLRHAMRGSRTGAGPTTLSLPKNFGPVTSGNSGGGLGELLRRQTTPS